MFSVLKCCARTHTVSRLADYCWIFWQSRSSAGSSLVRL